MIGYTYGVRLLDCLKEELIFVFLLPWKVEYPTYEGKHQNTIFYQQGKKVNMEEEPTFTIITSTLSDPHILLLS